MVSITNVSAGQAKQYYQKDNYYTKNTGQWQGKGAETLGLRGEIEQDDFLKLIYGKAPDGSFEIRAGGEAQKHRAGVDITFSAPKSVSIAAEVLGDDKVREAHDNAVEKTIEYIEKNYAQARQTQNGITEKVDTHNLVIAKFQHNTSRELDPQLHTHALFMNMTKRQDGEWRALSNEEIYENKMFFGQCYRNELAKNLQEIGYSVQSDHRGLFEIRGVDKNLNDHFSQRREQIQQKVQELKESDLYSNANNQKLKEIAALGSRVAKKNVDMNVVRESWQERLKEQGYNKEQIQENIQQATEQAKQNEANRTKKMNEHDIVRQAARIQTEQESTFSREDILKTAGRLSVGEHRISELEKAFNEQEKNKEIKQLNKNVYTTKEMYTIEKDIVSSVQKGHDSVRAISSKEQVERGIKAFEAQKGFTMTQGQKDAVGHVLTTKDRFIGIQGDAGTGKTTMLASVREQAEKRGYEVRGLSFTGKAADEVEKQAGIKSQTVDSFFAAKNIEAGNKQLWIVDEASMLGSKKMHELTKAAEKADARVVFVGDTKQMQAIEAGKMFEKLQKTGDLKTTRMSEVQRQKEYGYRQVVADISEKRIDKAFNKLEKQGRISEITDRQERLDAIVKDYTIRMSKDTIIVTARNADKNQLNKDIRTDLKQQGKLPQQQHAFAVRESKNTSPVEKHFAQSYQKNDIVIANKAGVIGRAGTEAKVTSVDQQNHKITVRVDEKKEHTIDLKKDGQSLAVYTEKEQSFSKSDKVVFLKNDKGLGVQNGQTGEIKSIDEKGNCKVKMESGEVKNINIKTQYSYMDHGYAVTDYKAQGQTSKDVIYHADTGKHVNYNQAYVAITRGKEDVRVYTDDKGNLQGKMKQEQVKTSTLDHEKSEVSGAQKQEKATGSETVKSLDRDSGMEMER